MLPMAVAPATPIIPQSDRLLDMGVRLALVIGVSFVAQRLLFFLVGRVEKWLVSAGHGSVHAEQRAHTLGQISRYVCTVLVAAIAVIRGLAILGWDVKPLIAGVGIVGVALGFGAQTLVRDMIAGIFILVEDQYAVGDLIEVGAKAATVEAITLRSTTLRDFNGYLHFVPNGEMRVVVNRSRGWHRLAVDVPIAADEDLGRALAICRRIAAAFSADPEWKERMLEPAQVWGIETFSGTEATIRLVVRSLPGPDAPEAARTLRQRVHEALRAEGVRFTVIAISAPAKAPIEGAGTA